MFCTSCGKKINDIAKFCPFCGAQTAVSGETANTPIEAQAAELSAASGAVPLEASGASPLEASGAVLLEASDAVPLAAPLEVPVATPLVLQSTELLTQEPLVTTDGAVLHTGTGKRRGRGLLLAIVAVIALVGTVGAVSVGGLLASPKTQVLRAATKSFDAYAAVAEKVGMPDLSGLMQSKKINESLSVRLKEVSDSDFGMLEGLGFQISGGVNLPDEKIHMEGSLSYGAMEAVSFSAQADGAVLTAYSPELFGTTAYALNTTTLGQDLEAWGVDESVKFQLFDLIQIYSQQPEMDKAAAKAFAAAIEVEKAGKESKDINGTSVDCATYQVRVPEDAMLDYLDAIKTAFRALDYGGKTIDMLEEMGVPSYELDSIRYDLELLDDTALFDEIEEAIRYMGDLKFDAYLSGGCLMAAVWEGPINGFDTEIGVYCGGGKQLADDFSLVLTADEESYTLKSSGNHMPKNGTFTDTTTLCAEGYGDSMLFRSELSYTPKQSENNFSWEFSGGEGGSDMVELTAEGQLNTTGKSLNLQLDELSLREYGSELCTLEVGYSIKPYAAVALKAEKTVLISELSRGAAEDLMQEIWDNAEDWAMDITDEVPGLRYLL